MNVSSNNYKKCEALLKDNQSDGLVTVRIPSLFNTIDSLFNTIEKVGVNLFYSSHGKSSPQHIAQAVESLSFSVAADTIFPGIHESSASKSGVAQESFAHVTLSSEGCQTFLSSRWQFVHHDPADKQRMAEILYLNRAGTGRMESNLTQQRTANVAEEESINGVLIIPLGSVTSCDV